MNYDLLVIGDELEGIERARSVARDGHRVAVVSSLGAGPSLDVICRAANNLLQNDDVNLTNWNREVTSLSHRRTVADHAELEGLGIDWISGLPSFVSRETVAVTVRGQKQFLSGSEIVLACGTQSHKSASLAVDGRFVIGLESLPGATAQPRTAIVVGGGESGLLTAMVLARMGVDVTVIDEHQSPFELAGLLDARFDTLQTLNVAFRLNDEAIGTELRPDLQAAVRLASGRLLVADMVVVCCGRDGRTDGLNLEAAGVGVDERGRVWCDAGGKTWANRISAVGSVVGFGRNWNQPPVDFPFNQLDFRRSVGSTLSC